MSKPGSKLPVLSRLVEANGYHCCFLLAIGIQLRRQFLQEGFTGGAVDPMVEKEQHIATLQVLPELHRLPGAIRQGEGVEVVP